MNGLFVFKINFNQNFFLITINAVINIITEHMIKIIGLKSIFDFFSEFSISAFSDKLSSVLLSDNSVTEISVSNSEISVVVCAVVVIFSVVVC